MTTATRTADIARIESIISQLHAELDACPNRDWDSAKNQGRMDLLIALTARLHELEAESFADATEDAETPRSRPVTFLVSRHYEIVTESSAGRGEPEETGTEFSGPMDLRDTVEQLREMHCTSRYPIRSAEDCRGTWAFTHEDIDFSTGESRTESLHITRRDGSPVAGRDLFRLYRLAGLVSVA